MQGTGRATSCGKGTARKIRRQTLTQIIYVRRQTSIPHLNTESIPKGSGLTLLSRWSRSSVVSCSNASVEKWVCAYLCRFLCATGVLSYRYGREHEQAEPVKMRGVEHCVCTTVTNARCLVFILCFGSEQANRCLACGRISKGQGGAGRHNSNTMVTRSNVSGGNENCSRAH